MLSRLAAAGLALAVSACTVCSRPDPTFTPARRFLQVAVHVSAGAVTVTWRFRRWQIIAARACP